MKVRLRAEKFNLLLICYLNGSRPFLSLLHGSHNANMQRDPTHQSNKVQTQGPLFGKINKSQHDRRINSSQLNLRMQDLILSVMEWNKKTSRLIFMKMNLTTFRSWFSGTAYNPYIAVWTFKGQFTQK